MSKKVSRISINKLESTMENNVEVFPMYDNHDIEITIRYDLPLQEVLQFVEDVVSSCIDSDTGRYIPEIKAFAIRASVLTRYANFTLPKDPEKQYDLIYNTRAYDQVMSHIDSDQYEEIVIAIDERIRHETAIMENAMMSQMTELMMKLNTFINNSEELFGSVKSEDMSALIKNLASAGKVDEDKLVNAVFNARNADKNSGDSPIVASDDDVITVRKKKD